MELNKLVQDLKISNIGENSNVTIVMDQGGEKDKKKNTHLINILAQKHLDMGGDLHSWIETCKFTIISEALKKYHTVNEASEKLGLRRNSLSVLKNTDKFLSFMEK